MRSILGLSSAAIMTVLLVTTAGGRFAAATPDDCSISGMQDSLACPLSTWTNPPAPQQQAGPTKACTPHYELYSSHVTWVNDCPAISQVPGTAPQPEQQAGPTKPCTPHYELYSSHVTWVNDCPAISQVPGTAPQTAH